MKINSKVLAWAVALTAPAPLTRASGT